MAMKLLGSLVAIYSSDQSDLTIMLFRRNFVEPTSADSLWFDPSLTGESLV
jgi:hypothetical protein